MNDLEQDLKHLLDERAGDVATTGDAPATVLRRGRRRQARTLAGAAIAGLVVIAVAVSTVASVRHPNTSTPAGPTNVAPGPSIASSGTLQIREADHGQIVVYGNDLGHDWQLRHDHGEIQLYLDGGASPDRSFPFQSGMVVAADTSGGTFLIGVFDLRTDSWSVTEDDASTNPGRTIEGRWTSAQDNDGRPVRLWLIALPDDGTGILTGTSMIQSFVSWPANRYPDGVFGAGSNGDVSWGILHHTDQCALVRVIGKDPSDSGTSPCLPSWHELDQHGGTPLVGGVYGQTVATAVVVLPEGTHVDAVGAKVDCFDITVESNFAGTRFCVVPLPVGSDASLTLDHDGDPLGGPIDLHARPGALDLTNVSPSP